MHDELPQDTEYNILHGTATRWLYNESLQHKLRYTPFDVDALTDIACTRVGATRCVSCSKFAEGAFNKVYLLEFDNGSKAVLRIPTPLIGNVELVTASEVATTCYLWERYEGTSISQLLPPKVLAWDSSYENPVGTPFILFEFIPGVRLLDRWDQSDLKGDNVKPMISGLASHETMLLQEPFSQIGSIFFAEDVSEELRARPLYRPGEEPADNILAKRLARKYRIGPLVDRDWWRGEYGKVDAHRGPWTDMETMIKSAAELQLSAMDTVVDFSLSMVKSDPSDAGLLRRMLKMTIELAAIVPLDDINPKLTEPVLKHPDISPRNLIVSPEGPANIQSIIDWQRATVVPFIMGVDLPSAISYDQSMISIPNDGSPPPWPEDFGTLSHEEQEIVRFHHRLASYHQAYLKVIDEVHPLRRFVWDNSALLAIASLPHVINRCIADGPHLLRDLLIFVQENWDTAGLGSYVACPIAFSEHEIAQHHDEENVRREYNGNVERLRKDVGCRDDGAVNEEDFDSSMEELKRHREEWDEDQMKGPFPMHEGAPVFPLT
ncbi:hypothetical protein K474DRAFT_1707795 [Panus rudis PR-1116 ss-1]|nr:hypothetical protein K474DRAFT_1707795 [Panus rudis PR-1116 ss-1]